MTAWRHNYDRDDRLNEIGYHVASPEILEGHLDDLVDLWIQTPYPGGESEGSRYLAYTWDDLYRSGGTVGDLADAVFDEWCARSDDPEALARETRYANDPCWPDDDPVTAEDIRRALGFRGA